MRRYQITITGTQPLLLHADSLEWSDSMDAWKNDKDNKKGSKAGDDRSPAWRWLGTLYHDNEHILFPAANVMKSLMDGGVMVPVPGGKSGKTFKAQTMSGILPTQAGWPVLINGKPIPVAKLLKLNGVKEFDKHKEVALAHGFSLFLKRAKIGQSKHVRVRPRFEKWSLIPVVTVLDEQITTQVLSDIAEMTGKFKGVGDWRPGSPKSPGSYGMFEATVKEIS
jgi:hypothetical protein